MGIARSSVRLSVSLSVPHGLLTGKRKSEEKSKLARTSPKKSNGCANFEFRRSNFDMGRVRVVQFLAGGRTL